MMSEYGANLSWDAIDNMDNVAIECLAMCQSSEAAAQKLRSTNATFYASQGITVE